MNFKRQHPPLTEADHQLVRPGAAVPLPGTIQPMGVIARRYLLAALVALRWNQTRTARALGLSKRTVRHWVQDLRELGLDIPVYAQPERGRRSSDDQAGSVRVRPDSRDWDPGPGEP